MSADQDALAAEWAAQLEADEGTTADPFDAATAAAAKPAAVDDLSFDTSTAASAAPSDDELASRWAEALAADEEPKHFQGGRDKQTLKAQASEAHFKDMTEIMRQPRADGAKRELDFILDIPLDVSAELGRTRLLINELLQLGQGSVVELNKLAGEPLEVFVNGKLVARGEAVVINEKFGVRLTDIISPMERVKQLG